jgi:GT2 family glycosyltransferase
MSPEALPVTVVIPTIGRDVQLKSALESVTACDPRPAEIVVVDQSGKPATAELVERFAALGARRVGVPGRSIGQATNAGFEAAAHETVFVTNDDCVVAPDWVAVGVRELEATPDAIVTGSVHAFGSADGVPSLRSDETPRDFTGTLQDGELYGANMVMSRAALLEFGGFDPRLRPSAEDNDLCYRWLRAGRSLRYEPTMRIWHHDWRTREHMRALYGRYGHGQGMFFAKHLRARDPKIVRFVIRDIYWNSESIVRAVLRGHRPPTSAWQALRHTPKGMREGWRTFAPSSRGRGA